MCSIGPRNFFEVFLLDFVVLFFGGFFARFPTFLRPAMVSSCIVELYGTWTGWIVLAINSSQRCTDDLVKAHRLSIRQESRAWKPNRFHANSGLGHGRIARFRLNFAFTLNYGL
jgi:hypothetical protein